MLDRNFFGYFVLFLFLFSSTKAMAAESVDFLDPKIEKIHRSTVCPTEKNCKALFVIQGKRFLNSNPDRGVKIGKEWGEILRWEDDLIVVVASEKQLNRTPIISIDNTIVRPELDTGDPILDQMFEESVDVAIEAIKIHDNGTRFISAGPKYENPERTYYRDSYWTSGLILFIEPFVVRNQILLLARGVEKNGSVPSAIPIDPDEPSIPLWLDHHDSGPYFIMMVYDYIRYTGDASILDEQVNDRTIWNTMKTIIAHLQSLDRDGNGLPEKPKNSLQDWLDSIPRGGEVLSNQVLYYRALRNLTEIARLIDETKDGLLFHRESMIVRYRIHKQFWQPKKGYYYERCEKKICVDRLTNESALAVLYGVGYGSVPETLLTSLEQLETRNNFAQPYGDWGVLNAYPLYENEDAYRYQNGTDWPFLDGINAGARLKQGNKDWYYPITRWWIYFDEHRGEDEKLPEFVSPIDSTFGLSQAWSVNPIVSYIRYGIGVDPKIDGSYQTSAAMVGNDKLRKIIIRGKRVSIEL